VDLDLTSDQELLRETTERYIQSSFSLERVRALIDGGKGPDSAYRASAAELGWFAFLASEELGGGSVSGNGVLDAAILAEERGRGLQPGPFIDTNVTVAALAADGNEEQQHKILPALIGGGAGAAWAVADTGGDWSGSSGVQCRAGSAGFSLSGEKGFVVEAQLADWILVTTALPEGPTQFLVERETPGLSVEALDGLDLTRTISTVRLDDVQVGSSALVGSVGGAGTIVERQLQLASVLSMAECVGAMGYLFNLTLDYCRARTAFGRPIGSFQAVKHQLADTSLLVEMSNAAAVGAAHAVQDQDADAGTAASAAMSFIGDAAIEVAHKCWQNFGGISYTWEHDFHLYLRRLTADAFLYGSPSWHRERICLLQGI
jgi:alkylation response protein AidB-like acyl-CoA dehydrogenase